MIPRLASVRPVWLQRATNRVAWRLVCCVISGMRVPGWTSPEDEQASAAYFCTLTDVLPTLEGHQANAGAILGIAGR